MGLAEGLGEGGREGGRETGRRKKAFETICMVRGRPTYNIQHTDIATTRQFDSPFVWYSFSQCSIIHVGGCILEELLVVIAIVPS